MFITKRIINITILKINARKVKIRSIEIPAIPALYFSEIRKEIKNAAKQSITETTAEVNRHNITIEIL